MKEKLFLVILFMFCVNFNQAQNYKITYSISQDKDVLYKRLNENNNLKSSASYFKKMLENSRPIDFFIIANSSKAFSYKKKTLSTDATSEILRNINNLLFQKSEFYYIDLKNDNYVFKKSINSKTFYVKFQPKDFKLINNQPVLINGYKCYLAENKDDNVKLWYTKDIPLNIGPKKYIGLPGLVVKVVINETIIIQLKSIEPTTEAIKLMPKNQEIISFEAYQKTVSKAANALFQKP
ncbi:GLPGLI family protein [Psychroflexus salarius]|nr:GLPGLI family protein [Psychroflexus salarius]